jgi:protein-S-isoprenylcysteine O-methyltransferase Ste14
LNGSRWTAGLNSFFLPHFSRTTDPLLDMLTPIGRYIALAGLLLFVAGALQVYSAKLLRRGEVTGGLYRVARHPQYAALILLGFGLLLIWPRFLVLFAFTTMIFLYVALARHEEELCVERFGDGYRDYSARVGMFGPKALSIGRFVPATLKALPTVVAWLLALAFAGLAGLLLREHSMSHLHALFNPAEAIVSPAPLDRAVIERARAVAGADPRIAAVLAREPRLITYVVPAEWSMPDLPIDPPETIAGGGHGAPRNFDRRRLQLLFARPRTHARAPERMSILRSAHGLDPLLVADVDLAANRVTALSRPPASVLWGDIPMPLF